MARDEAGKEKLSRMLLDLGLTVAPMEKIPPNADWGIAAQTPPPTRLTLNFIGLRSGLIVAGIGVMLSEPHRRALASLEATERVRLSARLLRSIVTVCSTCRVGLHGDVSQPTGVVAELLLEPDTLTITKLSDTVSKLVNVFLVVNTVLWEAFPALHLGEGGRSPSGRSGPQPETGFL